MTQQLVANLLKVDVQAVARWEKGNSAVPGPAQNLLRLLYEEKANGNTGISEPLRKLAELDEILQDENEIVEFEDSDEGWRQAA
jgi:transcriptional regulator with XRE-family HTH domain